MSSNNISVSVSVTSIETDIVVTAAVGGSGTAIPISDQTSRVTLSNRRDGQPFEYKVGSGSWELHLGQFNAQPIDVDLSATQVYLRMVWPGSVSVPVRVLTEVVSTDLFAGDLIVGTGDGGGGGAAVFDDLTDSATVDLPTVNAPLQTALALLAPLASPTFTGTPAASTASPGTSTTQISTTAFVQTAIAALVNSSPSALDTLNELATALGNDANFATTVTNALAAKAPLASPTFTGTPAAPTAAAGTNTTQLATTAHVLAERTNAATLTNKTLTAPTMTGSVGISGNYVLTAATMGALAVDVTNIANDKTISTSSTLTFSATPADGTLFGVYLANSSGSTVVLTFPSSVSVARGVTVTTAPIPAGTTVYLQWQRKGSLYLLWGEPAALDNIATTSSAPGATDDATKGYGIGSLWITTSSKNVYQCVDATASAAVWRQLDGSSGSGPAAFALGAAVAYATNSTSEHTMYTKTIPGGTFGASGALDVAFRTSCDDSGSADTWTVYLGGTLMYQYTVGGAGEKFAHHVLSITNKGDAAVQIASLANTFTLSDFGSAANSGWRTGTVNTAADQDFTVTVAKGAGTATSTLETCLGRFLTPTF